LKVLFIFLLLISLIHLVDFALELLSGVKAHTAIGSIINEYKTMDTIECIILICLLLSFFITIIYSFHKRKSQLKN